MTVRSLQELERVVLTSDDLVTKSEAQDLVARAKDWFAVSREEAEELASFVVNNADKLEPAAQKTFTKFFDGLERPPPSWIARDTPVAKTVTGPDPASLSDDLVVFERDGTMRGRTGIAPYVRGYNAKTQGPMRVAHGSPPPASMALPDAEHDALARTTPGAALDAAAAVFDAEVTGFERIAGTPEMFDPDAAYWRGKCHAWAWASLAKEIDQRVDVEGPAGSRGLWIGGQWLSRADLGVWMMGLADTISLSDHPQMFDSDLSASDLIKGTLQFLMDVQGGGVIADTFNDAEHGHAEVWNQPFVGSELTTCKVSDTVGRQICEIARSENGCTDAAVVKLVNIKGLYGVERDDSHEGPPATATRTWNVYAVLDARGRMLTAYMAGDPRLGGVTTRPCKSSDELPEYFWKPTHAAILDTLAGKPNATVDGDRYGPEFRFFLCTVLGKGVPGSVRTAFEEAVQTLPSDSALRADAIAGLVTRFPGVANAYSPDQWQRTFGPLGLAAGPFGATWPVSNDAMAAGGAPATTRG